MPGHVEYIRHYMGPVFFVNKQKIEYSTISRNVESCTNPQCPKHKEQVRTDAVHGVPLHCTECGSKIKMVNCEKSFEKMPSAYMESFHSKCCGVSNANVNGTSYFMEPAVKLFTEDACQVYVPTFVHQEFSFGAIDNKTVGIYCINDQCNLYQDYNKSSFKHCPKCGNKLIVNVTHNVQGVLPPEKALSLFNKCTQTNYDSIKFATDHDWATLVDSYAETDDCKEIITAIETAYGQGSVSMLIAFVSYHTHY